MKRNKSRTENNSTVPVCSKFPSPKASSCQQTFPLGVCPISFCIVYTLVSRVPQNHRMVKVVTDHWRSSNPASLLKQGSLKHVTQDFVQIAFDYLLWRRFHNLFGRPLPVLSNTVKKFSLNLRNELYLVWRNVSLKLFSDNCITFKSSYKTIHHLLILIIILYF